MSLIQSWESVYGVSLKEAYHKILEANFNYLTGEITLSIGIYCDELSKTTGKPPIYIRKIVLLVDEKALPIREPLYEHLKTTTNYQEAENI